LKCWLCSFETESWKEMWKHHKEKHPRSMRVFYQKLDEMLREWWEDRETFEAPEVQEKYSPLVMLALKRLLDET